MDKKLLKFTDIKRQGEIKTKVIEAIVQTIDNPNGKNSGKPYLKLTLRQDQHSYMHALSFDQVHIDEWMKVLTEGQVYKFPEGTFKAVKEDTKYASKFGKKYKLFFISGPQSQSGQIPSTSASNSDLARVIATSKKRGWFEENSVKDLEFNSDRKPRVFRYWGCPKCRTKISHTSSGDGLCKNSKTCDGMKNGGKPRCFAIIKDIVVQDSCNFTLKNLSSFDMTFLFNVLGISYDDLCIYTDEEINWRFEKCLLPGIKFEATIKRANKKSGSKYTQYDAPIVLDHITFPKNFIPKQCTETFHYEPVISLEMRSSENTLPGLNSPDENKGRLDTKILEGSTYELPTLPSLNIEGWDPKTAVNIKDKLVYPITSTPRGLVLLINNKNYAPEIANQLEPSGETTSVAIDMTRHGSEVDVKNLISLFNKINFQLYKGRVIEDITSRQELAETISDYKNELIKSKVDSSIVIVMGHGNKFEIELVGNDQNTANLMKDIIEPMTCRNFNEFGDKPRIFIVQACQGFAISDYTRSLQLNNAEYENILVCLPGLPGFPTWRTPNGSFFIHYLIKVIMEYGITEDIIDILKIVQREMRKDFLMQNVTTISVPYYESVLFHKFYLIGNDEENNQVQGEEAVFYDAEDMEID